MTFQLSPPPPGKSLIKTMWAKEKILMTLIFSYSSNIFYPMKDKFNIQPITRRQVFDSSKLKKFADDNFKFDKNGRKLSNRVKTLWEKEKLLVTSNFSFSHSVFKRLVSQGCQKVSLCGNGLSNICHLQILGI